MVSRKIKSRNGVTLLELIITMAVATIVIVGIGVFMVDIQRGWGRMFSRVHSDVVADAYIARKAFDGIVRKSARHYWIGADGSSVEVEYWNDTANNDATLPDRYARFYLSDNRLLVEHGIRSPRTELRTDVLAEDVTGCTFSGIGTALKMSLFLDNGSEAISLVSSGVMHN